MADPPLAPEPESEPRPVNQSRMDRMRVSLHRHRDVENGSYSGNFGETNTRGNESLKRGKGGYMDLVSNVWHWHAVEWGGRCKLHFGFASILLSVFASGLASFSTLVLSWFPDTRQSMTQRRHTPSSLGPFNLI